MIISPGTKNTKKMFQAQESLREELENNQK